MPISSFGLAVSSAPLSASVYTRGTTQVSAATARVAFGSRRNCITAASVDGAIQWTSATTNPRNHHPTITFAHPNPQLQFTASFAPAATPCELHPTSAHPPHATSHHRECCPSTRLTLFPAERMVHA